MTAFTQEMLTALESAIAEGARKVKYQDKEIEYRSLDEMMKVRDLIRRELGIVDSDGTNRKVGVYGSGL